MTVYEGAEWHYSIIGMFIVTARQCAKYENGFPHSRSIRLVSHRIILFEPALAKIRYNQRVFSPMLAAMSSLITHAKKAS